MTAATPETPPEEQGDTEQREDIVWELLDELRPLLEVRVELSDEEQRGVAFLGSALDRPVSARRKGG